jgi:hypothetical protein
MGRGGFDGEVNKVDTILQRERSSDFRKLNINFKEISLAAKV